jgi:hypothetical protein
LPGTSSTPTRTFESNYQKLRDDDREIMNIIRDFFGAADVAPTARAVDIGAGTNLYPAFAMLPFCAGIELVEFSESNVAWLRTQIPRYADNWDDFWRIYAEHEGYARISAPRAEFAAKTTVRRGSIFLLPPHTWDLGTMFFVACSLSAHPAEFRGAVHSFVRSLKPGAPFATAFMANSEGYYVNDHWYPAVAVGPDDIRESLEPVAYAVRIHPIDVGEPLREGYGGMIVATGLAGHRGKEMAVD